MVPSMVRNPGPLSETRQMKKIVAALSAVVALAALSGSAEARPRGEPGLVIEVGHRGDHRRHEREDRYDSLLSERRVERMLMRRGFIEIEDIELRRDRYIVRAVRPNGALVRLAIDAYDGEIIARERIGWVGGRGYDRHRGRAGIEFRFGNGEFGIYGR